MKRREALLSILLSTAASAPLLAPADALAETTGNMRNVLEVLVAICIGLTQPVAVFLAIYSLILIS